jgi:uncharacterized protein YukE
MAVATITTVVISAVKIAAAVNTMFTLINNMKQLKESLVAMRETDMQNAWRGESNVDSRAFADKLRELDADIQIAVSILEEYEQLLRKAQQDYTNTQTQVHQNATSLRSPRA